MGITEEAGHSLSGVLVERKLQERFVGDLHQGFGWPWHEPDHSRVVHQTRVHTAVVTKVVPCLAHQEHYVEVVLDCCEERLQQELVLQGLGLARVPHCTPQYLPHFILNCPVILFTEQIWNLTDRQNSVNILHERLLCDLVIGEDKHC